MTRAGGYLANLLEENGKPVLNQFNFFQIVWRMYRESSDKKLYLRHDTPEPRRLCSLEVTSPPPEGGGFDLRLKSPKDLASDAGDSLDRLSHSARRPLP